MRGDIHDADVRAEVLRRLATLEAASERRWGKMDAHQAMCHLADAFDLVAGRRKASPIKGLPLPGPLLRLVALRLPVRWPRGAPTVPEADQTKGGTPPSEFEADRGRLVALIEEFAAWPEDRSRPRHVFFGLMSRKDWGRWAYRHMDHHLRQFGH